MYLRALSLAFILASNLSFADNSPFSYNYASIGYLFADIADEEFSGFSFTGSAALNQILFIQGEYATLTSEDEYSFVFGTDEIEADSLSVGFGVHAAASPTVDFVATISYEEIEINVLDDSEMGYGHSIELGVRSMTSSQIELNAAANRSEIEGEGDTSFLVGARFPLNPTSSIGITHESADDADGILIDLRFGF